MFDWLFSSLFISPRRQYQKRRLCLLKQLPKDNGLNKYLSVPLPDLNSPLSNVDIVSVDFETTGLNAKQDKILSIGCVSLQNRQIKLNSCFHKIIDVGQALDANNVTIHTITDNESQGGEELKQVMDTFLTLISGKVLLVHFNKIEREFFNQACIKIYGAAPILPIIDTLVLANKELLKQGLPFEPQDLTLINLRKRANLPLYQQHNALSDAIATAELYLTMIDSQTTSNMLLKDVLI